MKKNNIIKTVLTSILCVSLVTACDVLDQPYDMGYDADMVFTSPERVESAMIGVYDAMQNLEYLGGRCQIYVDIRSMDTNPASYFGAVSTFDPTASNGIVQNAWTGAYATIAATNVFLESLAANPGIVSATKEQQYIAEAKFIRAVTYFYTLNLWGQQYAEQGDDLGIPLVLRSYDGGTAFSDEAKVPRSTIAQCWEQIEKDLTEAATHLPTTYPDAQSNLSRATKAAAYAFLSRVYLYQKKYGDVITVANQVTGYELDADYSSIFAFPPTESNEIIFFVAMSESDNPNTNNALGQHYGANYRGDITVSNDYLSLLESTDKRLTELIVDKSGTKYTTKYPDGSYDWAPVIRYAEVLLNKAEALAQNANDVSTEALTIINDEIRARAGVGNKTAATKTDLINLILDERRRELAFEGHGSFDLFRNGRGIAAGRGGAVVAAMDYPNNFFVLPIPQADITKEPDVLKQNYGY